MKHHGGNDQPGNHDVDINHKHGETTLSTLRKIYGKTFAAGYQDSAKLGDVIAKLNVTSLTQLRRDYETRHLDKKIAKASA